MTLPEIIMTKQDPELVQLLDEYVKEKFPRFRKVLESSLILHPTGSISVSEAFWLFNLVVDLKPEVVIESGTLRGCSRHLLEKAAPLAEIISYDPGCDPEYKYRGRHQRCDWSASSWAYTGKKCFVFFDDHISHERRLKECMDRGVKNVVFHDNYLSLLHSHKPIRFCELPPQVVLCYTFDRITSDPIFVDTKLNPQNYRWLTWLSLM